MGLIVIEGLDGAGKSTQIKKLYEDLSAQGHKCRILHFPRTESPVYGNLVARFLRGELGKIDEVNPYLVALIYAGDRLDFKPVLESWLREGDMVLLDRYVYSNVAYQCAKLENAKDRQELREWIIHLEFEHHGLPKPDLNIFLDVPYGFTRNNLEGERTGEERRYLQDQKDIHEADFQFQKKVHEIYLSLINEDNFVKIDCSDKDSVLPVGQIAGKIWKVLSEKRKI